MTRPMDDSRPPRMTVALQDRRFPRKLPRGAKNTERTLKFIFLFNRTSIAPQLVLIACHHPLTHLMNCKAAFPSPACFFITVR